MLHALEDFFFPRTPTLHVPQKQYRNMVLLDGCETVEEHYARIKHVLELICDLHGHEGLRAVGFEYRMVPCDEHKPKQEQDETSDLGDDDESGEEDDDDIPLRPLPLLPDGIFPHSSPQPELMSSDITSSLRSTDSIMIETNNVAKNPPTYCRGRH